MPHAHDCLTTGLERARQRRHSYPVPKSVLDFSTLIIREARGPTEDLAFSFRSAEASLGVLDQQVPLELRDGIEDVHGQLAA